MVHGSTSIDPRGLVVERLIHVLPVPTFARMFFQPLRFCSWTRLFDRSLWDPETSAQVAAVRCLSAHKNNQQVTRSVIPNPTTAAPPGSRVSPVTSKKNARAAIRNPITINQQEETKSLHKELDNMDSTAHSNTSQKSKKRTKKSDVPSAAPIFLRVRLK